MPLPTPGRTMSLTREAGWASATAAARTRVTRPVATVVRVRMLSSSPGSERAGIGDAREVAAGVLVHLDGAGLGVGDGQRVLDGGQRAVEEPELLVDGAAVEDLGHHLDVRRVEEPEPAGVAGERHGVAGAAVPLEVLPGRGHREAAAVQTEPAGAGRADAGRGARIGAGG